MLNRRIAAPDHQVHPARLADGRRDRPGRGADRRGPDEGAGHRLPGRRREAVPVDPRRSPEHRGEGVARAAARGRGGAQGAGTRRIRARRDRRLRSGRSAAWDLFVRGRLTYMRRNRIPTAVRLQRRIDLLEARKEEARHHPAGSNPYWACRHCGIRDPQLSIDGRHFHGCPVQGLDREIAYYRRLLNANERA